MDAQTEKRDGGCTRKKKFAPGDNTPKAFRGAWSAGARNKHMPGGSNRPAEVLSPEEEELRKVEARLKVVKDIWGQEHTLRSATEDHHRAQASLAEADRTPRFVPDGSGRLVTSTADIGALLRANEALELLSKMENKEPEHELRRLLRRRMELMLAIMNMRA